MLWKRDLIIQTPLIMLLSFVQGGFQNRLFNYFRTILSKQRKCWVSTSSVENLIYGKKWQINHLFMTWLIKLMILCHLSLVSFKSLMKRIKKRHQNHNFKFKKIRKKQRLKTKKLKLRMNKWIKILQKSINSWLYKKNCKIKQIWKLLKRLTYSKNSKRLQHLLPNLKKKKLLIRFLRIIKTLWRGISKN